ncbi:MAG TPA: N-6 DNA methylase [Thermoplasmata archaeon]|nr:N-6 DNA methylase [Thermoplasmata archaeon]HIH97743.1 N-6 DNA methylase [Thermoplasmata archaeon]
MKTNCRDQEQNHFSKKEKVLGQFFTPKRVVDFVLDFVELNQNKKGKVADPACGDGIFLKGLTARGYRDVVGIDIDKEMIESIPEDIKSSAVVLNKEGLLDDLENGFDAVVGNPPFSAKYGRVKDKEILTRFEFGKNRKTQAVEILFLERFIRLTSQDGVIGIILPYGIISNRNLKFIRDYLFEKTQILGVVSLPRFIFNKNFSTSSKTCILFLKKCRAENKEIFMSIVRDLKDLREILRLYPTRKEKNSLVFWTETQDNNLSPEFYNPETKKIEEELKNSPLEIEKLKELITNMFLGGTEYGEKREFSAEGEPFISAKVVTNLGLDFERDRRFVSRNNRMFKKGALVRRNDLIFVRVGVGCAGRSSVVTSYDELGVVDDWSYVIRTKEALSPYFLSFYLQTRYGKAQVDKIKRGVGTVTIPQALLGEILIPILEDQDQFRALYLGMKKSHKEGDTKKAKETLCRAVRIIEKSISQKTAS